MGSSFYQDCGGNIGEVWWLKLVPGHILPILSDAALSRCLIYNGLEETSPILLCNGTVTPLMTAT